MADTVEIIARAVDHQLWDRGDAIPNVKSEQALADAQHDSLGRAEDVIASLTAAGRAVVSREPTERQSITGARVLRDNMNNANFSARVREVYKAMIGEADTEIDKALDFMDEVLDDAMIREVGK